MPQLHDQTALLRSRNELHRHHAPALRMQPANQRFDAHDMALPIHHRVVIQHKLVVLQAMPQVQLQRRTARHRRLHFRVKKSHGVAPSLLSLIHRQVCPLEQVIHALLLAAE